MEAMKKNYGQPSVSAAMMEAGRLLVGSGAISAEEQGIGYGGVDTEGQLKASSRQQRGQWDDWSDGDDAE